jgi:hypothetical protein
MKIVEQAGHRSMSCACLTYYTVAGAAHDEGAKSRNSIITSVKNGAELKQHGKVIDAYGFVAEMALKAFPQELLSGRAIVPVPSSSKYEEDAHWSGWLLAHALAAVGDDLTVNISLTREHAVQKSSTAKKERKDRPSVVEHVASMRCKRVAPSKPILLIDDVVTSGTTLIACRELLRSNGFTGEISGLAVAYTRNRDDSSPKDGVTVNCAWNGRLKWANRIA